jgi:hypothetical protein
VSTFLIYVERGEESTSLDFGSMGRSVDIEDLVSAAEVAEILGLAHHNSVTTYLHRYSDFPRPIIEKSNGRIRLWDRMDIHRWQQRRGND